MNNSSNELEWILKDYFLERLRDEKFEDEYLQSIELDFIASGTREKTQFRRDLAAESTSSTQDQWNQTPFYYRYDIQGTAQLYFQKGKLTKADRVEMLQWFDGSMTKIIQESSYPDIISSGGSFITLTEFTRSHPASKILLNAGLIKVEEKTKEPDDVQISSSTDEEEKREEQMKSLMMILSLMMGVLLLVISIIFMGYFAKRKDRSRSRRRRSQQVDEKPSHDTITVGTTNSSSITISDGKMDGKESPTASDTDSATKPPRTESDIEPPTVSPPLDDANDMSAAPLIPDEGCYSESSIIVPGTKYEKSAPAVLQKEGTNVSPIIPDTKTGGGTNLRIDREDSVVLDTISDTEFNKDSATRSKAYSYATPDTASPVTSEIDSSMKLSDDPPILSEIGNDDTSSISAKNCSLTSGQTDTHTSATLIMASGTHAVRGILSAVVSIHNCGTDSESDLYTDEETEDPKVPEKGKETTAPVFTNGKKCRILNTESEI